MTQTMQMALCEAIRDEFAAAGYTAIGVELMDMGASLAVAAMRKGDAMKAVRVRKWWRKSAGEILAEFQREDRPL